MKLRIIGTVDPIEFSKDKIVDHIDGCTNKYSLEWVGKNYRFHPDSVACAFFKDGTILACVTSHTGPYSEVTPDIDYDVRFYSVEKVSKN